MIARNAERLGTPELTVVQARAPDCLPDLPAPDAVFVGGGIGEPAMLETCWQALRPGGPPGRERGHRGGRAAAARLAGRCTAASCSGSRSPGSMRSAAIAPGGRSLAGDPARRAQAVTTGRLLGVGVGPGDPELLTLKAVRILREGPVIAYVSAERPAEHGATASRREHLPPGSRGDQYRPADAARAGARPCRL